MNQLDELQVQVAGWSAKNFPNDTVELIALGVAEETGELCHSILKAEQGIRLNQDHDVMGQDAVGDIILCLLSLCHRKGWLLSKCLEKAWDEVKDRNWTKEANK